MEKFNESQSPQTGQVYFNQYLEEMVYMLDEIQSQSPQTGQVYFNRIAKQLDNSKVQ